MIHTPTIIPLEHQVQEGQHQICYSLSYLAPSCGANHNS